MSPGFEETLYDCVMLEEEEEYGICPQDYQINFQQRTKSSPEEKSDLHKFQGSQNMRFPLSCMA